MRKLLVCLAVRAIVSPAFAWEIGVIPTVAGNTSPHRPEVDGHYIVAAPNIGGGTGGLVYNTSTMTQWVNVAPIQVQLGGYGWSPSADVAGNYAAFSGAPATLSQTYGINVFRFSDHAVMNIPCGEVDEHLTSLNSAGDVLWQDWGNTDGVAGVMYSSVASGTPTAPVQLVTVPLGSAGTLRMRAATDSRRFAYRPDNAAGSSLFVYDLAVPSNTQVFNQATDLDGAGRAVKAFLPGIDDTGNWMVSNMRPLATQPGEVGQSSDIWLFNLNNLGAVTHVALSGNYAAVRNDPRMQQLDADTAIVVWGEDPSNTNSTFRVKAAYVTGLSSTPVWGAPFQITDGTKNCNFPDVDVDEAGRIVVAWSNATDATIEYTFIPEPASLGLLALGGLALLRRR